MAADKRHYPEWVPEGGGEGYTTQVLDGVEGGHDGLQRPGAPVSRGSKSPRRAALTVNDYVDGVLAGDRTVLARAITLVESNSAKHIETAQEMLKGLLPYTGDSMRVGITGVPGAGKSTLIEAMGCYLCDKGHRVAVLAVDPSSSRTRGSILGDKTRMEMLGRHKNAFIRPSPSGGVLGGVARKSRETMLVCEAAGYDVMLVETVGVGQSEVTVRSMVDFFMLVLIAGAGDELQGMKKGIMEITDTIVVNKADGDNRPAAEAARQEYRRILHYLRPATEGWMTEALTASAKYGDGIPELWAVVQNFRERTTASGVFAARRRDQTIEWVHGMVRDYLQTSFFQHPGVKEALPGLEKAVAGGEVSPTLAVQQLVRLYEERD